MKLCLFVLFAALLAVNAWEEQWMEPEEGNHHDHHRRPKFCGKFPCPRFCTVARRKGYDVRCYGGYTMATTRAAEVDQKNFGDEFLRLLTYLRGSNVARKKLPMAVPVSTFMYYNITTHKVKSALSFYVPTRCNSTAPAPTDSLVKVWNKRRFCAYVRAFPGYSMGRSKLMYMNLFWLSKAIKASGKSYVRGVSLSETYNSPRQRFFRHNEVWRIPSRRAQEEYLDIAQQKHPEIFEETCE